MHNNGNIENNQSQHSTGLPKGPEMNDRDRINDILATQKYLSDGYNVAVNEAGTDELFQTQLQLLNEIHQSQREIFKLMQQKGWYKLEPEQDKAKITQKAQQFAGYRAQFPYS